jgi:tetratricopeptide (TPR) repeat protein
MRALFVVLSLIITAISVTFDFTHPAPDSPVCLYGLCRYDQVFAAIDAQGMNPRTVGALLNVDPSNPLVWSTWAETLAAAGRTREAASAFDESVALGPGMSPVLMRRANFDFAQGRLDDGFRMTNAILKQTDVFDQVLFSYLTLSKRPVSELAGVAVPALSRPAASWLSWLRTAGSEKDLLELSSWMLGNHLLDRKSASDLAWAFWQRKEFTNAQKFWSDWLGNPNAADLHSERLADVRFQQPPGESPFDWMVTPVAGVEINRKDGLEIQFSGSSNLAFANVRQFTTVAGGRYRFSALISADNISTDQGPFFHIYDLLDPRILNITTEQIRGNVARSRISLDVPVPPGVHALAIQIDRLLSQKFDNKIAGILHVYEVSLAPAH